MRVFLSSTYEDLKAHRGVLLDTLQKMGDHLRIVAMEYFGADPRPPLLVCQEKVSECDAYVGVFGWRYGSIDQESRLSMTEIEYRTALAKNIPAFLYLMSENQAVPPAAIDTGPGASKLKKLKQEMAGRHIFQRFTTPEDLSRLVVADLARHMSSAEKPEEAVNVSGPVGPEINPGHPYILCHISRLWGGLTKLLALDPTRSFYSVRLFIDVYTEEEEERRELFRVVDRVVYQFHESFTVPVVPMQNWEECFVYDCLIWGEIWFRATIYFKDPTISQIHLVRYINLDFPDELKRQIGGNETPPNTGPQADG